MTFVLDASVAIKWVLKEPGSDEAERILGRSLFAPDLFQTEIGHVLTKRVRRAELSEEQALTGYRQVVSLVPLIPARPLGQTAFELSLELHHAIHDCYYLAAAQQSESPLITADGTFVRKLRATGRGRLVHLLGEGLPDG